MPKEKQTVEPSKKLEAAIKLLREKLSQLGVEAEGKKIVIKDNKVTIE